MVSRALKATIAVIIAAIAAYWYWSPFITVRQLQLAAQKKDADAFNAHVDYPKIRLSLKGQISSLLADKLAQPAESDNDVASAGAALGAMIGMTVANQIIDVMVQPDTIMRAMQNGQLAPRVTSAVAGAPRADKQPNRQDSAGAQDGKPSWTYERQGVNKLVAYASNTNKPGQLAQEKFGLVLQRTGFANWKMTEVRLPALNR